MMCHTVTLWMSACRVLADWCIVFVHFLADSVLVGGPLTRIYAESFIHIILNIMILLITALSLLV